MFPNPPAIIIGLCNPKCDLVLSSNFSNDLKYPRIFGLPNSLLNDAAPIGPSIIISKGDAILSGFNSLPSQLSIEFGILKFETEKPHNPALGFDPIPVAPSSLISPPEPVAAPGKGAIAVG